MVALHQEEIDYHFERINLLQRYDDWWNRYGLEFPASTKQIGKFEKKIEDIAVNVWYIYQEDRKAEMDLSNVLKHAELEKVLTKLSEINILWGSDYNITLANLVNLLLMTGLKKKHYTAIENLSRLISRKNTNSQKLTITVV